VCVLGPLPRREQLIRARGPSNGWVAHCDRPERLTSETLVQAVQSVISHSRTKRRARLLRRSHSIGGAGLQSAFSW